MYELSVSLREELLEYLQTCPYVDVLSLMRGLEGLEFVIDEEIKDTECQN